MTVFDELENRRRCRGKLVGVVVRFGGDEYAVLETRYFAEGLLLKLSESGPLWAKPTECELASNWSPACCRPAV